MTYDELNAICERQYENGFGDVIELHIDQPGFDELARSLHASKFPSLSTVTNVVTGTPIKIIRHENHVVVQRQPPPPPTIQKVLV